MCLPSLRFHEAPFYARSRSPPAWLKMAKAQCQEDASTFFLRMVALKPELLSW
jgi:hypothetical protein